MVARFVAVLLVLGVAAADVRATIPQDYVDLPLRLDLIADPSTAVVPTGWTPMETFELFNHPSQLYGWDVEPPESYDSNAFTDDEPFGFLIGDFIMPEIYPVDSFRDEQVALFRDGHAYLHHKIEDRRRIFRVAVDPTLDTVLVRVLLGRAADVYDVTPPDVATYITHAVQIHEGAITDPESTVGLVTLEEYPWVDGTPPHPPHTGVWSRTLLAKVEFEPPFSKTGSGQESAMRNIWFKLNTDQSQSEYALVEFTIDVDTNLNDTDHDVPYVDAIEVHSYEAPPASWDVTQGIIVNSATFNWPSQPDQDNFEDGIADLLAGQMTDALDHFDNIVDDRLSATGHLWAVGWLDTATPLMAGDPVEWNSIQTAISLFEGASGTGPSWAYEYALRAREYERALLHQRWRGYSKVRVPNVDGGAFFPNPVPGKPGGIPTMLINIGIAEANWRDIGAQQLEAVVGNPYIDPNPLFFKACTYLGINYWHRKPLWSSDDVNLMTEDWAMVKAQYTLWKGFDDLGWFTDVNEVNTGPFAGHDTLAQANHMEIYEDPNDMDSIREYDEFIPNGPIKTYLGEDRSVIYGASDTRWWDTILQDADQLTSCIGVSQMPDWAAAASRYQLGLLEAHNWWAEFGTVDGEYGGGGPDDIEFVLLQVKATLPFRGTVEGVESAAKAASDINLEPYDGKGYFSGNDTPCQSGDVEHTAEETSNALWAMQLLDPGEPYYLEYALQSLARMETPYDPGGSFPCTPIPWTEADVTVPGVTAHNYPLDENVGTPEDPISLRRFVSYYIDAEGAVPGTAGASDDHHGDVPLNGRAVLPAFFLVAYNNNPAAAELLREWAEWWWVVAMDDGTLTDPAAPDQDKPLGVLPGTVNFDGVYLHYGWPSNDVNAEWWSGSPSWNFAYEFEQQRAHHHFIYGMFLTRFLDPDSDDSGTTLHEGLDYLKPLYEVARTVAEVYRINNHQANPLYSWPTNDWQIEGTDYWTAVKLSNSRPILQQIQLALPYFPLFGDMNVAGTLFDDRNADVITWATGAILDSNQMIGLSQKLSHDKDELASLIDHGYNWIAGFFPLFTTWVGYTDRIFIDPTGAAEAAFAAASGGSLENPPNIRFTWEAVEESAVQANTLPPNVVPMHIGEPQQDLSRIFLYNLEVDPLPADGLDERLVRLRLWYMNTPGEYRLQIGPNDGNDQIDPLFTYDDQLFSITKFGGEVAFSVPYAPDQCGEEWIVELTRLGDLDPADDIQGFVDVANTEHDFEIAFANDEVSFTAPVHSIGNQGHSSVYAAIYVYAAADGGGEPTGPWYPLNVGFGGTNILVPASTLAVNGQTTLIPEVEQFSFAPISWTASVDAWLRADYYVFTLEGLDPVPDFNPSNDFVSEMIFLPSSP